MTEEQKEAIGQCVEQIDAYGAALQIPMPAEFHMNQLKEALPEAVMGLKLALSDAGFDFWDDHPDMIEARSKKGTSQ